jgi:hypothetical protein
MNRWPPYSSPFSAFLFVIVLALSACASNPDMQDTDPGSKFEDRIQTQQNDGIQVSVAVPDAKETEKLFGKDLYKRRIQPVWLKIVNQKDIPITFMPVGIDPIYYSPLEAANIDVRTDREIDSRSLVNRFFLDQGMDLIILPGEELSGFIFTQLDEGTKSFNVDVVYRDGFETFPFFVPVPGLKIDHYDVNWKSLYPPDQFTDMEELQLVEFIEDLQCCVTNKAGTDTGDPLNLVIIGEPLDVYIAFMRAGWDETETVTTKSSWKTMRSFISGGEYRYSPVSSLYVFDRPQDVAFQKARDNIHERNHLRLWMSPARFQGLPVWIGQISRDIGVRFTKKTITTHKIDPNVDETREFLLENLAYAQSLQKIGYVKGVGAVPEDSPRGNLTGDPWFTDGFRLVLWVTSEPTALSDLEVLPWRNPYDPNWKYSIYHKP